MGEYIPIRNLKAGMKDLTLMFIVLDVGRPNQTKDGHEVRTVKVADKTGAVNLSVWDEPGKLIASGDIIRMTKGYTSVWKGCLTLYVAKTGDFHRVGDFCLIFSETPFLSEYSAEYAAAGPVGTGGQPFGGRGNNGNNAVGAGTQVGDGARRFPTTAANGGPGGPPGGGGGGGGWGGRGGGGGGAAKSGKDKTR